MPLGQVPTYVVSGTHCAEARRAMAERLEITLLGGRWGDLDGCWGGWELSQPRSFQPPLEPLHIAPHLLALEIGFIHDMAGARVDLELHGLVETLQRLVELPRLRSARVGRSRRAGSTAVS